MGRGQLDHYGLDGLITSKILVDIVWNFVQTKCSLYWLTEKCGGLIRSCCLRNPAEKVISVRLETAKGAFQFSIVKNCYAKIGVAFPGANRDNKRVTNCSVRTRNCTSHHNQKYRICCSFSLCSLKKKKT